MSLRLPLLLLTLASASPTSALGQPAARDAYGGSRSRTFDATGFYRLAREDDRDWIVTPAGGATFLLGVNHAHNFLRRPDGARLTGEPAKRRARQVVKDLRRWGFNTVGYGGPKQARDAYPFIEQMNTSGCSRWRTKARFKYEDVFDPAYEQAVGRLIQAVCKPVKDNPNLVGYFWTANPEWGPALARRRRGTDWVSTLRTLPADAPGRRAYVAFLEERYGDDLARFEAAYGLSAADGLAAIDYAALDPERENVAADDLVFLGRIAERYYSTIARLTRAADPNHLVFGERLALRDLPRVVLDAAVPHIDVLSVQPMTMGFDRTTFDELHRVTGKPILVSDHSVAYPTDEYPETLWEDVEDAPAVGREYARFLEEAFSRPYFVGYLRCEYADHVVGEVLRQGIRQLDGTPRAAVVTAMIEANARALARTDRPADGGDGSDR